MLPPPPDGEKRVFYVEQSCSRSSVAPPFAPYATAFVESRNEQAGRRGRRPSTSARRGTVL